MVHKPKAAICISTGRRIRVLRRDESQQMLADRATISREHWSEIENGNKEVGIITLEKIALALGVRPSELLE